MTPSPHSSSTTREASDRYSRRIVFQGILGALVLFGVAAILRLFGLDQQAVHDELYHFLAAKTFLTDGTLTINGGEPYARAKSFTLIVARTMESFGSSLSAARVPALLAGSILGSLLFLWLWSQGERVAAWIAGALVCLDPILVQLSQIVRFYSLQHLVFLGGAIAIFGAYRVRNRPTLSLSAALLGSGLLAYAYRLQITALVGMVGIMLFLSGAGVLGLHRRLTRRRFRIALTVGVVLGLAALALLVSTPWFQSVLSVAGHADRWAQPSADNFRFYYAFLHGHYGPLWSLVPLLFVLGYRRNREATLYCTTIFLVGFLTHSYLPWKAERYFGYLLPFLFVIFALGLVEGIPYLRQLGDKVMRRARGSLPRIVSRRILSIGFVAVILISLGIGNYAFIETYRLATRDHTYTFPLMGPFDGTVSWERAAPVIRPMMTPETVVVAGDDLKAIHYLGRLDYALSPSHLSERTAEDEEFWRDPRVDRPVVSEPSSIERIIRCHRHGLIVIQTMSWNNPISVPQATAEYIERHTSSVDLPADWGIEVFRWTTEQPERLPGCRHKI